jgi:sulfite dehydrogenase (quinone) subunit SoeA
LHPTHDLDLAPKLSDEVRKTTCYMCACRCGIDVHMRDGKVRYIEGNRDHPVNRGVLCAKGSAGIMQHYVAARLRGRCCGPGRGARASSGRSRGTRRSGSPTEWLGTVRADATRRSSPSSPGATRARR